MTTTYHNSTVETLPPSAPAVTVLTGDSSKGKTPSCYRCKTFALVPVSRSISTYKDGTVSTRDSYVTSLKNGAVINVTFFHECGSWFFRKSSAFRGNWIELAIVG